jgi:hypothetical protein
LESCKFSAIFYSINLKEGDSFGNLHMHGRKILIHLKAVGFEDLYWIEQAQVRTQPNMLTY